MVARGEMPEPPLTDVLRSGQRQSLSGCVQEAAESDLGSNTRSCDGGLILVDLGQRLREGLPKILIFTVAKKAGRIEKLRVSSRFNHRPDNASSEPTTFQYVTPAEQCAIVRVDHAGIRRASAYSQLVEVRC
jgi:hypothetical protein